ncbi:MAG: alanine racemase [Saprospiraceae bacterium]|nr:alanine racemase [Saprospiraceae bacterium]
MHRLGFLKPDIEDLCSIINQNKQIQVVSIFSHLSASDQSAFDDFTREQSHLFKEMANCIIDTLGYKPLLHLLNSGGIARHPDLQFDMVRLGIGLYGIDNDPELAKKLEKVHTLKTRVSQIKSYTQGETVSYNRSGKIINPSKIGVLSIGYADGLPRIAGSRAYRLYCGRIAVPLIGVVCMDMCMVDLSAVNQTYDGMEIEIFGKTNPIEELARISDTIPYEILCGISTRVKRVFLQD